MWIVGPIPVVGFGTYGEDLLDTEFLTRSGGRARVAGDRARHHAAPPAKVTALPGLKRAFPPVPSRVDHEIGRWEAGGRVLQPPVYCSVNDVIAGAYCPGRVVRISRGVGCICHKGSPQSVATRRADLQDDVVLEPPRTAEN
jgi:hypothetical protein